jgi:hypothetical protein
MIQTNLLLATKGRTPDSFIMMDPDAFATGHLDGDGIYWRGAILRRDGFVLSCYNRRHIVGCHRHWPLLRGGQIALGMRLLR